jgi:RimJ/RimL family protein N-acetyltransferase
LAGVICNEFHKASAPRRIGSSKLADWQVGVNRSGWTEGTIRSSPRKAKSPAQYLLAKVNRKKVATPDVVLRRATMLDAEILLAWRNDPATRNNSLTTSSIDAKEHGRWLASTLSNSERQLWIAETDGRPVGTVRVDHDDAGYLLSWTVAPEARSQGVGKLMVADIVGRLGSGAIRAEVKADNLASVRIAEHVGLKLQFERDGLLVFSRGLTT